MMRAGTVLLCLSAALPAPFASGSGVNHGPDVPGPWGLTVDYLKDPVGIDGDAPRFSWKLPAGMKSQSAFQIDAGIWKTDRIVSGESVNAAVWKGPALVSSQRVRWRVRVWDGEGRASGWSRPASFTVGIADRADWKARWIGPNRKTRPDVDFGRASWLAGEKAGCTFVWDGSEGVCELVYSCTRPHRIIVNGRVFSKSEGMVYDFRHLRFRDLRPFLKKGENGLVFEFPEGAFADIAQRDPPGRSAVLAVIRFPCGRTLVSDASWDATVLCKADEAGWYAEIDRREEVVSPAFAKDFRVRKGVRTATLHISGLGFYEASVNGRKVGDKVLDPAPTDYCKRVLYSTYEVERMLVEGVNEIGVELGHGWYDVRSVATWNDDVAPWRGFPRCIAQLEIEYEDGTVQYVVSDGSWRQTAGETVYDCIREGSVVREAPPAPAEPVSAEEVPPPAGALCAGCMPGAKIVRRIAPSDVRGLGDGRWIVSFPENVSGWVSMRMRGLRRNDVVRIRYDENLLPDGGVTRSRGPDERWRRWNDDDRLIDIHYRYPASHRFAPGEAGFQIDRYIASGRSEERYEPRFTYNGFRHVVVDGLRAGLGKEDVEACFVRNDFDVVGEFSCSDAVLTKLVEMAKNSYLANFTGGFPTDCPHREKMGWTGDGWMASEMAQYYFENTAAYGKWLTDIIDTQRDDGLICAVAPTGGWGYKTYNGPTFDAVLATLPWNLFVYRGDRAALDAAYPALCRYIGATARRASGSGLVSDGLGDWNAAVASRMPSPEYVISAHYYHILAIAAKIAREKGLADDAARFSAMARRTADAINRRYRKGDGVYDNGGQTAQSLPLTLGFAEAGEHPRVCARLIESVEKTGGHVELGLVGMKHVFRALTIAGRSDLAIRMLTNPTAPSPAAWIGKTSTLWEDWRNGYSKCHVMFADFSAWAVQHLAGVRLTEDAGAVPDPPVPGFRRFVVAPDLECGLSWARFSFDGPYGRVSSFWRKTGGTAVLEVEVPPNSEATVCFGSVRRRFGAGRHTVSSPVAAFSSAR